MKKLTGTLLLQFFLLYSVSVVAQFQPTEVVRSQEKTLVNGKIFYIHTVQKGQTLYSISKAYEVTQEEIKNANPQVDVINLREGLAIRIPDSKSRQAAVYPQNKEDFIAHTVKRGQTVYSLSKRYDIDEAVIYHYNPWSREGIQPDQTLWIPRKKEMPEIVETVPTNDLFYLYTVKEKDTLYSISKTYGVDVAAVINANPELRNGLRPGQVLKIPRMETPGTEWTTNADTLAEEALPCIGRDQGAVYEIALMLPFFAKLQVEEQEIPTDTIAEEGTYVPQQKQQGLRGRNFAEFYEGFMLALDSLKETGLSVNLHVYDTERDTLNVKKIIRELSLINPDLIIGPVYAEDVNIAGRLARYQDVKLVSPLSTRPSLVARNNSIIQVVPSRHDESYALANYLMESKRGRIILIRGTDSISMTNSWIFKKYLTENIPVDSIGNPLYFKDYRLNDSLINVIGKVLSKEEENLVIVFSDYEPDVSSLVTKLFMMASLYPTKLFGMPSWQSWTNIDLNYFHSLQLHLLTPFYIDYARPEVKRFLTRSRAVYGSEPYEISSIGYNYSMLGYDIGFYFLSALKQFGKNFLPCIDQVVADQLLTRYHFQKAGQGGYVNNSFSLVQYKKDFTIERNAMLNGQPIMPAAISPVPDNASDTLPPLPLPVE